MERAAKMVPGSSRPSTCPSAADDVRRPRAFAKTPVRVSRSPAAGDLEGEGNPRTRRASESSRSAWPDTDDEGPSARKGSSSRSKDATPCSRMKSAIWARRRNPGSVTAAMKKPETTRRKTHHTNCQVLLPKEKGGRRVLVPLASRMFNTSDNVTGCEPQKINAFIPIFLSFVFFVGFILNCISLWIFWFRITQWNPTMILQFNLAIADAVITPAAPLIIAYSLTDHWVFGTFLCQLKVFLLSAHMYGSIYFLTLISLHRYFTVAHNIKGSILTKKSFITKLCLFVWGCLCLQGFPFFFTMKTTDVHGATKCLSFHQSDLAVLFFVWNWVIIFSGLLVPFSVTIICYSLLSRHILKVNPMNLNSRIMLTKSIRTIAVSLVIFIVCYVPVHITRTLGVTVALFFPNLCSLLENVEIAYYITWMMSGTNCCMDPILYCFASEHFKKTFMSCFTPLQWLRRSQDVTTSTAQHSHGESPETQSASHPTVSTLNVDLSQDSVSQSQA